MSYTGEKVAEKSPYYNIDTLIYVGKDVVLELHNSLPKVNTGTIICIHGSVVVRPSIMDRMRVAWCKFVKTIGW
jgi:hypothetical protein